MRIRPARALLACGLMAVLCLAPAAAEKKKPKRPINVNTATPAELAQLPGVGEVIAARIVRHREVSGKFRSVNELVVVRGISRKTLEKLRPYVTVKPGEKAGSSRFDFRSPSRATDEGLRSE